MADRYEPGNFEAKWRNRWQEADLFRTREVPGAQKFYGLDFFPYPSGAGLSIGHCRNYVPTDVICRMKAMQGFNVLHPMGFDAFGLPAENEAIKRGTHPAEMIERYAARYREQMELIGVSYDWSRSFKSSDPSYYKWTQWIFGLLYNRGLAYRKQVAVNWDPGDNTVLADEEVVGGRAERSGALVEKRFIPQWMFKITEYAQRLIDDLDLVDWPEGIKNQQRNWIGRSEGVQFTMKVDDSKAEFDVFTTRIDTIFGMTFCVLSPEHPAVASLPVSEEDRARIAEYQAEAKLLSDIDRTSTTRQKTGVFTGARAINPANGERVPIWLADYVLATYGTGAIMAVPGHDDRDFEFAEKFGIPVIPVIAETAELKTPELPFVSKDGFLINSGEYSGLPVAVAQVSLGEWIEGLGIGTRKIQYKLRDWLVSRQRYWGCPIPIVHTKEGDMELVPVDQLPVELPPVERYEPSGDGTSPLAAIPDFVNVTDSDGRLGRRETDTMSGFACSSWYFLRFCDPENHEEAFNPAKVAEWMPVDCYVGGAEHAVMHLLYARFWTKVLYDAGLISIQEPFQRLQNQGQILGRTPYRSPRENERLAVGEEGILMSYAEAAEHPPEDITWRWSRMSKSKGNVVSPEEAVGEYGADALRLYLLFVAPFNADVEWKTEGISAMARFLSRIFKLVEVQKPRFEPAWKNLIPFEEPDEVSRKIRRVTHQTVRVCTEDIERFSFNTYASWMMKFVNALNDEIPSGELTVAQTLAVSEAIEALVLLLAPGAPHSADELWESLNMPGFTMNAEWPNFDPELAVEDLVTIAVSVNGKLRDTFQLAVGASDEEHETAALACPKVAPYLEGKTLRKVIVVAGKVVNLVAN